MSDSVMRIDKYGNKFYKFCRDSHGRFHRIDGPAIESIIGRKEWWLNGEFLGHDEKGFWEFWDRLTPEQKKNPVLLSYLPGDFNV